MVNRYRPKAIVGTQWIDRSDNYWDILYRDEDYLLLYDKYEGYKLLHIHCDYFTKVLCPCDIPVPERIIRLMKFLKE